MLAVAQPAEYICTLHGALYLVYAVVLQVLSMSAVLPMVQLPQSIVIVHTSRERLILWSIWQRPLMDFLALQADIAWLIP